jgi:hypothetical protein
MRHIENIQSGKSTRHTLFREGIETALMTIEKEIVRRTGDCQSRCAVLQSQMPVLKKQTIIIRQNGLSLDEDLRLDKVFDFERIAGFLEQIDCLQKKVQF